MPEGPTLKILEEATARFAGHKVLEAKGYAKIDLDRLIGSKVTAIDSWGKHFLISFEGFYVRVHFLMFGSYSIDTVKPNRKIALGLELPNGSLNFYASNIKVFEGTVKDAYDFSSDVMRPEWDQAKARKKLLKVPEAMICDALLEQQIFAGVGNIIKNEILYRARVHPESAVGKIPSIKKKRILEQAVIYPQEFLEYKKEGNRALSKHWEAYSKKKCKRCDLPMIKKVTGKMKRRSFFCTNCQIKY